MSQDKPATFRKKPVIVKAVLWSGGPTQILEDFCGRNWHRADVVGSETWPSDIADTEQVVLWNNIEKTWLPLPVGWWIVRGIEGEFYPCRADIFAQTYEEVTANG